MVDDVLRRQQRAVVVGGAAELRKQVLAAALAPQRDLPREVGDDALTALDAAGHLRAGPGLADWRDSRCDHVDERLHDLVDLRSDIGAEERCRGQVQRHLFHRRIEQDRPWLRRPFRNARRDSGIQAGKIRLHRSGLEGDRQRPPVQAMFLEVEQHQAAREQPAEHHLPAPGGGKQFRLVEQHQLVRLRPEQRHAGLAENAAAIDAAVLRRHLLDLAPRVGKDGQGTADDRPALITRDMGQRLALHALETDRGRC